MQNGRIEKHAVVALCFDPMAGRSHPIPSTETASERLAEAVEQLTDNVRVLTVVVEAIREEIQWLTRNGIPHQTLTVQIVSAAEENAGPRVERVVRETPPEERPATARELDLACDWLGESLAEMLQEQLNLILSAVQPPPASSSPSVNRTVPSSSPAPSPPSAAHPSAHSPRAAQSLFQFDEESIAAAKAEHPTPPVAHQPVPLAPSPSLPPVVLWNVGDAVDLIVGGREVWGEIIAVEDATNTATVQLIPSEDVIAVCMDDLRREWSTAQSRTSDPLSESLPVMFPLTSSDSRTPTPPQMNPPQRNAPPTGRRKGTTRKKPRKS